MIAGYVAGVIVRTNGREIERQIRASERKKTSRPNCIFLSYDSPPKHSICANSLPSLPQGPKRGGRERGREVFGVLEPRNFYREVRKPKASYPAWQALEREREKENRARATREEREGEGKGKF